MEPAPSIPGAALVLPPLGGHPRGRVAVGRGAGGAHNAPCVPMVSVAALIQDTGCSLLPLRVTARKKKHPGHAGPRGNAGNTGQVCSLLPLPKAALAWESQGRGTAASPAGMTAGWGGGSGGGGQCILPSEHRSRHGRARRCCFSGGQLPGALVLLLPFEPLPAMEGKSGILGLTAGRPGFICRPGQQAVGTTYIQPVGCCGVGGSPISSRVQKQPGSCRDQPLGMCWVPPAPAAGTSGAADRWLVSRTDTPTGPKHSTIRDQTPKQPSDLTRLLLMAKGIVGCSSQQGGRARSSLPGTLRCRRA